MVSNYKQTEMAVYKIAVQLERLVKERKIADSDQLSIEICDLQQRLTEKKFRIAVVGEFNRGKSSLINVLLGKRILPEDVLATTATINRVTYGTQPKAYLVMKDGNRKTEDIPVENLVSYVTKLTESSAKKAAEIREAVVEYPTMLCYNDVDLIDTPGMNDVDDMNAVTINRLENIDLAVVAISALLPFSETERNFVIKLIESANICQVIFVVTHMDQVRQRDREKLIPFLKNRIRLNVWEGLKKNHAPDDMIFQKYHMIFDDVKLYTVSSWEGMDALEAGDMALYEKSGFLKLTRDLPEIILNSRSVQLTVNIAYRLNELIEKYEHGLISQTLIYDNWVRKLEEVFQKIDIKSELDTVIPQIEEKEKEKIMQEKKPIARKLLNSLITAQQLSFNAVRDAILPTMKSEFARINQMYRESQANADKEISILLKHEILLFSDEVEKLLGENQKLLSLERKRLNDFRTKLVQTETNFNFDYSDMFYFYWTESPIDIVMNTLDGENLLQKLMPMLNASLGEGNKKLSETMRRSYSVMASEHLKRIACLRDGMLSQVQSLKITESEKKSTIIQLKEMKEQCHSILKEVNLSDLQ